MHDTELRERWGAETAFLSGNEPLVTVLRSALSRDIKRRKRANIRSADRDPKTCIQLVYAYKKAEVRNPEPPFEHVLVFDEAQRAWDERTTQNGIAENDREGYAGLSESGLILSVLDRHQDWAVLVALIGEGQEINTGEAGLPEWGRTMVDHFQHWKIVASPHALNEGNSSPMGSLFSSVRRSGLDVQENSDLHLDNPNRQFRGRTVAEWADSVLDLRPEFANKIASKNAEYPIRLTRDLRAAKDWARVQSRGTERYGIICASGAKRLRADGVTVPGPKTPDVDHWFLGPHSDVRSSFKMEVAATEFQVQGLEIDWAVICWGGDLSIDKEGRWNLREFRGTKWQRVKQTIHQNYLVNTYRVLLTRARQGFVIYVPLGDASDLTHAPHFYDNTYEYLRKCGAEPLGRDV